MTRVPLHVIVGDRTIVGGRLAEVTMIFPEDHVLAGGARVRFVKPPRTTLIVRIASLEYVGFAETSGGAS